METLRLHQTRKKKIEYLVGIMGTKGDDAPSLFITCVRDANEHIAHPKLADRMEKWFQDSLQEYPADTPMNGSENTTQTAQTSQKSHQQLDLRSGFSVIDGNVINLDREVDLCRTTISTTVSTTQDSRIKEQALVQTAKVPIQERTKTTSLSNRKKPSSLADNLPTHLPISSHATRNSDSVVVTAGPSTQAAAGHRTPTTKIKVSPIVSTSPFLSARKRRKVEPEFDLSTIPALSFSEAADQNASLFADTLTDTPTGRVSALTSIFTTMGKRSKVNPQMEAVALWKEEASICVCTVCVGTIIIILYIE